MGKSKGSKKKTVGIAILAILLILVVGVGAYAAYGSYKMGQLAEMTFEEMLAYTTEENEDAVITVGIVRDGEMTFEVYGENGRPLPRNEHIYEIGSITKTFTTSLLCKAVSEGRIALDQPIDAYLDLGPKEHYPTIQELATHTSGYKEYYIEKPMISNFFEGENAFRGISGEMLLQRLEKTELKKADHPFRYSSFGTAVLGAVLEQVYGKEYTPLMNEYISEDLGLANTRISDGTGDLSHYWTWAQDDAYIPAGALTSTISDMMRYLAIHMSEKQDYLAVSHEALAPGDAPAAYAKTGVRIDAIGLGWIIDEENNIIWHNGGTSDYNSYLGFDKEKQIGVVILSNLPPKHRIPATIMGIELLTSLQEEAEAQAEAGAESLFENIFEAVDYEHILMYGDTKLWDDEKNLGIDLDGDGSNEELIISKGFEGEVILTGVRAATPDQRAASVDFWSLNFSELLPASLKKGNGIGERCFIQISCCDIDEDGIKEVLISAGDKRAANITAIYQYSAGTEAPFRYCGNLGADTVVRYVGDKTLHAFIGDICDNRYDTYIYEGETITKMN